MSSHRRRLFSALILLFGTSSPVHSEVVGLSSGEFRVDESGGASYSIGINVPEGRAGVTPQISLGYSSNNTQDGPVGIGWSIGGISAITRCPQTPIHDNAITGVNFTSSDRFCLDGQRLILLSGSYGAPYSTYIKAIDDFSVITAMGGTEATGPDYFEVQTKAGETYYYGNPQLSGLVTTNQADAYVEPSNKTGLAKTWAVKVIKDVKNNYILFNYINSKAEGSFYIDNIQYSVKLGDSTAANQIKFEYDDYTKGFLGYQAGAVARHKKILKRIDSSVDGSIFRSYFLTYENSNFIEERTLLTSVQECPDNDADMANCLPKTSFNWQRPALSTSSMIYKCEREPGVPDLCEWVPADTNFKPFENYTTVGSGSTNVTTSQVFDINGDGYQDIIYVNGSNWNVKLGPNFGTAQTMASTGASKKEYALNIDYNGDGVRDLLVANSATTNWHALSFQSSTQEYQVCLKGEPCEDHIRQLNYTLKNLGILATGLENGAQVMDVNGDGHEDIVFSAGNFIKAHINNGNGSFTANKTLYTFTDTVSSTDLNLGIQTQTADMKSASAVDVNGDGRSDLVMKVTTTVSGCYVGGRLDRYVSDPIECRIDLMGTWKTETSTNHLLFVSTGTLLNPQLNLQQTLGKYDDTLRVADLNGDGLSDLLYVSSDKWWYRLSDGVQFLASRDAGLTTSSTKKYLNQFVDLNGDGRADVLHATSTSSWSIYFSRPVTIGDKINFEYRGIMTFDANATVRFGDTTGDGKLNLLTSTGSSWKQYYNRKNIKEYAINTITNGFGVKTQITYQPMTNAAVYVTNGSDADATTNTFSPHSGMQLVSRVETESNLGVNDKVSVSYQYGGFLVHKQGRGSLGFQMLRTIDNQTKVITETRYSQAHGSNDYAQAGMPVETIQSREGQLLSRAVNTLDVLATANGGVWPYIASSEEESYVLDSNLVSTLTSVTNTTNQYDSWGNLLESEVTVLDEFSNDTLTTTNTNTYGTGDWERFGRLATASVIKTRTGDPKTHVRETSFDYYPDLMLKSSILSPNQAATKLTTVYGYDTWGNKTSVAVTGYSTATGSSITRTTTSNYGAKGRYLKYTDDALGFRTSFLYNNLDADAVSGVIKSIKTTDANNVAKIEYFDDLGRLKSIDHPDAKTTTVTQAFCSSCPNNAYYFVRTTLTGNPTEEVYFDKWGREVVAQKTGFDGTWNKVIKQYDSQGREYRVYEPNSSVYTEFTYDELNRPQVVTKPNGATVKNYLYGFESRTLNELGVQSSTYQNGFGETAYTLDATGNTVTFSYDAQGNVTETVTTGEGTAYTVAVTYDNWGRKLTTNDPSKGLWRYSYNAFGELYTQTTARNHTFTFSYDKLGRKTRSYELNEGTLCWNYGISSDKGRLLSTEKYEGVNATCASDSPTYKNSFSYYPDGLVKSTSTLINGVTYTQSQTYDSYSRPLVTTYPMGTAAFAVKNVYNGSGYLSEIRNNATNALLKRVDSMTARNQVDKVTYGNNVTTTADFEDNTGWLSSVDVKSGANLPLVYTEVTHDDIGNVLSRWSKYGTSPGSNSQFTETYGYDYLSNRLEDRSISITSGSAALPTSFKEYQNFDYDDWGNIKFKTGVGSYYYDKNNPHRLIDICQGSSCNVNTVAATAQCPEGYSKQSINGLCEKLVYATEAWQTPQYICPPSHYLVGNMCNYDFSGGGTTSSLSMAKFVPPEDCIGGSCPKPATLSVCPYGYTVVGSKCYTVSTASPVYSCPVGYTLSGQTCTSRPQSAYHMTYDANGNTKTDGTRTFTYGSFDMATLIVKSGSSSTMQYGPERELIYKSDSFVENGKSVTYQTTYLGNYEKVYRTGGAGTLTEHKFYIGDIIFTQRSNGSNDTFYLHKDHQGSVIATTNASGTVVSQAIYDPWGKRSTVYLESLLANFTYSEPTDRGYTGHKHIKDLDIIHMGGRIYDPTIGRFLQADPNIQAPLDSQSYNRYAYVRNNPMSMTDPSGYFFKSLFGFVKKYWRVIAAIVVTVYLGPAASAFFGSTIAGGAVAGAVAGAISTGSLRGALVGAISGAMFGSLHNMSAGALKVAAHGVAGGISSVLSGGKFGHGFLSAGLTQAMGNVKGVFTNAPQGMARIGNAVKAAVIGGTISKISGGKFANGALTGVFSRLLNDDALLGGKKSTLSAKYEKGLEHVKNAVDEYGVLDMFEGKIASGTTVEFKIDNSMDVAMQVRSDFPSTVYVNTDNIANYQSNHIASTVGHELVHVQDMQYALANRITDPGFVAQSEVNASNWQINNASHFNFKSYDRYMNGVKKYKLDNCRVRPSMQGC
jgi:RHS repeat-associated protein